MANSGPRPAEYAGAVASVFGKVLLITGPAEFLADRALRKAVATVRSSAPEVDVAEVTGSAVAPGELVTLMSPSLFCPQSAIVIRDLQDLSDGPQAELLLHAQSPSSDVAAVLVHSGGNKGKGLVDKLRKCPAVSEIKCPAVKYEREHVAWVRSEIRGMGGTIDEAAATLLIRAIGLDLRGLAGAADQLFNSVERGTPIGGEIVRKYFGGRAEVKGFDIADAAVEGRVAAALEQLRWAETNKVASVLITSAFASGLRSLAKLATAPPGLRDGDLASQIGAPPFRIKALRSQLRGWDEPGLARALTAVARADIEVKGGAADAAYALERMVLDVIRSRRHR